MTKNKFLVGLTILIGILILSPMTALAQQHYLQYLADAFEPMDESYTYSRGTTNMYFTHDGPSTGRYFHTVNFNKPVGHSLYIKSIAIQYFDNDALGLTVVLKRRNLWTHAIHTVATWTSSGAQNVLRSASQGTIAGRKFIDTQKFVYWLEIYWPAASTQLYCYQIRVSYGS